MDGQPKLFTQVFDPLDPRSSPEMNEAKSKVIKGVIDRGPFKAILKEDVKPDEKILPGHFILVIMYSEDGIVNFNARHFIGVHRYEMKLMMVHNSQKLQHASIKLTIALASAYKFRVWTSNVRQAYLQSSIPFLRYMCITNIAPGFSLSPEHCLQILNPLYGLCDAGDL